MKQQAVPSSTLLLKNKSERSTRTQAFRSVVLRKRDRSKTLIARLRAELNNLNNKFTSVFNSSNCSFIILDKDLKVIDFNKIASKQVRKLFQKNITCGSCLLNFFQPSAVKAINDNIARSFSGGKLIIERKINYSNKRFGWWSFEFSPASDSAGHIDRIVLNAIDITRRKIDEEKIKVQKQKLMEISSKQSHEIRGPVSTILGLMNLIKEDNYEPDREYLLLLESTTEQLDKNIREIVNMAETDEDQP